MTENIITEIAHRWESRGDTMTLAVNDIQAAISDMPAGAVNARLIITPSIDSNFGWVEEIEVELEYDRPETAEDVAAREAEAQAEAAAQARQAEEARVQRRLSELQTLRRLMDRYGIPQVHSADCAIHTEPSGSPTVCTCQFPKDVP